MNSTPAECAAGSYASNNPDISGVGVRASFYLQTFLLVLLVDRSWQDATMSLWTFIGTSGGLILAAVILRDQLTFFQALQVSNLVWLANFGTFFALASYSRQSCKKKNHSEHVYYKVKLGAMIQSLVSMALTLYMWGKAKTFGPENLVQCSYLVKYMFFVIEVEAITVGRLVSIPIICVLTAIYLVITLQELYSYRKKTSSISKKLILPTQSRIMSPVTFPLPLDSLSPASPSIHAPSMITGTPSFPPSASSPRRTTISSHLTLSPLQKAKLGCNKRRPKRRRWSSDLDPMLVGIVICQIMVFTYFIVSTELLLRRNPSNNDTSAQWSFGQILALVVVIPSAFSLIEAINEHGLSRISVHEKETKQEKKLNAPEPELCGV